MISFVAMILFILSLLLFVLYGSLMTWYWLGWNSLPDFLIPEQRPAIQFSIIIPARNEEENIAGLLAALEKQSYPRELFEVIVVDDRSTDRTTDVVLRFPQVKLFRLNDDVLNSFKKRAIEEGIAAAKNKFIITTDADCRPSSEWLSSMASFKEKKESVFIAAPVLYDVRKKNLLTVFQALDFLVLQGITMVSVEKKLFSMCNGANLGYDKQAFFEVDGFKSIDKIASGDDMLLMQKISKKFPGKVHYLKSRRAIVSTEPAKTWKVFFNQRLRWASKAAFYKEKNIFWVQLLVYVFNFSFFILLVAGIWELRFLYLFLALWLAKTIIELPFVYSVATWFNRRPLMKWFLIFQPLHILYTVVIGFLSQFIKYEWKGRAVR
jgi:cellulose synthase/poly-beta-1,6-N-acetylglucosamine synthase-like glycosyltransferase